MLIASLLTFLGGSLYAIDMPPPLWRTNTLVNPVVYLISGFRWSFFNTWMSASATASGRPWPSWCCALRPCSGSSRPGISSRRNRSEPRYLLIMGRRTCQKCFATVLRTWMNRGRTNSQSRPHPRRACKLIASGGPLSNLASAERLCSVYRCHRELE